MLKFVIILSLGQNPFTVERNPFVVMANPFTVTPGQAFVIDPPQPTVLETYLEAAARAHAAGKPIIVYAGCPVRDLQGTITHRAETFDGLDQPGIVVGRIKDDWFERIDLPPGATDAEILRAAGLGPKLRLPAVSTDCGCQSGKACKCLAEGRRCNCRPDVPQRQSQAPLPVLTAPVSDIECES